MFDSNTTASDVLRDVDLRGRRALVTGGAAGIGAEIARALTAAGADVTLAVRDVAAGVTTAEDIHATTGLQRPGVLPLDLMSPESIAAAAESWDGPLDILIANAGVMVPPEQRTAEGWESQFMTNYLGHFGLITRLSGALSEGAGARVVLASSNAHLLGPLNISTVLDRNRQYEPWTAYAESKTAMILFAVEAHRRWAANGVIVSAYNPGFVRTGLQKHMPATLLGSANGAKTVEQGAAIPVFLAGSPAAADAGGKYFEGFAAAEPAVDEPRDMRRPETFRGVAPFALDGATAADLWLLSEHATRQW